MKIELEYGIGMRNIKTALSVFLCILISKALRLEYPFYAVIAAIISMENSIANSLKVGRNRIMGTMVGAAVGLAFALIQPDNAILCGLGIVVIIYICNILKWNNAISIAGVVFVAIMLNLNGKSPLQYSLNRIIDTFIGISVSILVNYLIFPHNHGKLLVKDVEELSTKISSGISRMICLGLSADLNEIEKEISNIDKRMNTYDSEIKIKRSENENIDSLKLKMELYKHIYSHLVMIQELSPANLLSPDNIEEFKKLGFNDFVETCYLGNETDIVYNYHAARITGDIRKLSSL